MLPRERTQDRTCYALSSALSRAPRWSPAQLHRGGRSPCRGLGGLPGPGTLAREPEVDPKMGLAPGLPGTTAELRAGAVLLLTLLALWDACVLRAQVAPAG